MSADVPTEEAERANRVWGVGRWVACPGDCPLYSGAVPQPFVIHGIDAHPPREEPGQ